MEALSDSSEGPMVTVEVGDFDGSRLPARYNIVLPRGEAETWEIEVQASGELDREDQALRAEERAQALATILQSLVLVTKPLGDYENPRCRLLGNRARDVRIWFAVTGWTDDLIDPLEQWKGEHPYHSNRMCSAHTGLVYGQVTTGGRLREVAKEVERTHVVRLREDLGERPGDNLTYLREDRLTDDHFMAQYLRGDAQGAPDAVRVWLGMFARPVEITDGVAAGADDESKAMVTPFNVGRFIADRNRFCTAFKRASDGRCCPLCP